MMTVETNGERVERAFEGFLNSKPPLPSMPKSGPSTFSVAEASKKSPNGPFAGGPSDSLNPSSSVKSPALVVKPVCDDEEDSGEETDYCDEFECECVVKGPVVNEMVSKNYDIAEKWELQRYSVSWKWNWLEAQAQEVEHQTLLCDERLRALKEKRGGVRRGEKKYKKGSQFLKGHGLKATDPHPLFQTNPKRKRSPERKRQRDRKTTETKKEEEQAEGEVTPFATPDRKRKRSEVLKKTPTKGKSIGKKSPAKAASLPAATSQRKISRSSHFDIDNVVIPFNFSFQTPINVPKIERVDIHTPIWRFLEPGDSRSGITSSSRRPVKEKEVVEGLSSSCPDSLQDSLIEGVEDSMLDISSDEDTDDEAYYQRHRPMEIRERKVAGVSIEDNSKKNPYVSRRTVAQTNQKTPEKRKSDIPSDLEDTFFVTSEMIDPDEEKELGNSAERDPPAKIECDPPLERKQVEYASQANYDSLEGGQVDPPMPCKQQVDCDKNWQVSPRESKQGKILLCFRVAS